MYIYLYIFIYKNGAYSEQAGCSWGRRIHPRILLRSHHVRPCDAPAAEPVVSDPLGLQCTRVCAKLRLGPMSKSKFCEPLHEQWSRQRKRLRICDSAKSPYHCHTEVLDFQSLDCTEAGSCGGHPCFVFHGTSRRGQSAQVVAVVQRSKSNCHRGG